MWEWVDGYTQTLADLQSILIGFKGQPYAVSPEHLDPADCP